MTMDARTRGTNEKVFVIRISASSPRVNVGLFSVQGFVPDPRCSGTPTFIHGEPGGSCTSILWRASKCEKPPPKRRLGRTRPEDRSCTPRRPTIVISRRAVAVRYSMPGAVALR
jgi:hypothetical protein